jgi:methylthioribose-1-phosphate isomerase
MAGRSRPYGSALRNDGFAIHGDNHRIMAKKPERAHDTVRAVSWEDGALVILDQRRLPAAEEYLRLRSVAAVEDAIRNMAVRGAPAIGIAAAYGVVLAARESYERHGSRWRAGLAPLLESLVRSRPTAVNLGWAARRMQSAFAGIDGNPEEDLLVEARRIHKEDIAANLRIGELGAVLLVGGGSEQPVGPLSILTHCNAGSLATGGYGTALGVVRSVHAAGRLGMVYVPETRPWLQGARLTAWELGRDGVPATVLADAAAGMLMRSGRVQCVIVGSDRVAANGDVINKIGTYSLAVLARQHGIPFMVAAPVSSIDPAASCGADVPVEERDAAELSSFGGVQIVPSGARVLNPVFDLTPAEYVRWLVTEAGVAEHPDRGRIEALFQPS